MERVSNNEFGKVVVQYFAPLAERVGVPLTQLRDDIYEIAGECFVVRIRRGAGHRKDFVVTLGPEASRARDLDDLHDEIGLGVVAEYEGKEYPEPNVSSLDGFRFAIRDAAKIASEIYLPYLLGSKSDYNQIREFVDRKVNESGIRTKKYHLPRSVREEWL